MNVQTGFIINQILISIAFLIWIYLIIKVISSLVKKDYLLLKKSVLYIINTIVFLAGAIFYADLALITQTPQFKTRSALLDYLLKKSINEFLNYLIISILITVTLFMINIIYCKWIIKETNKRELKFLAVIDFAILVVMSFTAVLNYYLVFSFTK